MKDIRHLCMHNLCCDSVFTVSLKVTQRSLQKTRSLLNSSEQTKCKCRWFHGGVHLTLMNLLRARGASDSWAIKLVDYSDIILSLSHKTENDNALCVTNTCNSVKSGRIILSENLIHCFLYGKRTGLIDMMPRCVLSESIHKVREITMNGFLRMNLIPFLLQILVIDVLHQSYHDFRGRVISHWFFYARVQFRRSK